MEPSVGLYELGDASGVFAWASTLRWCSRLGLRHPQLQESDSDEFLRAEHHHRCSLIAMTAQLTHSASVTHRPSHDHASERIFATNDVKLPFVEQCIKPKTSPVGTIATT